MKKALAIFLCIAMMLTMTSCGTASSGASGGQGGDEPVTLVFKSLAWIKAERRTPRHPGTNCFQRLGQCLAGAFDCFRDR